MLSGHIQLVSLKDIGCLENIPETAKTLEGNARIKADHITEHYGYNCFADDTGLEVHSLNGVPGVHSPDMEVSLEMLIKIWISS